MLFGLDGVEISLIIVFGTLFAAILSGFPVAFSIAGAGLLSFALIAALDSAGLLLKETIDYNSPEYAALIAEGIARETISLFRYPELPRITEPLFSQGWEHAFNRFPGLSITNIYDRAIAGQGIETLLAVLMFVLMGIILERSRIAEELLTSMARVFGPLPGGLAVSVIVVGAFLAASTGIVGATVVTMGLLALPTMLRNGYSPGLATGVISASGTLGQIIPPSLVIILLGSLAGDLYNRSQNERAEALGCPDALTFLGEPAVLSVGTLFQAALLPGIFLAVLYAVYAFGYALLNPSKAPAVVFESNDRSSQVIYGNPHLWFGILPLALIIALSTGFTTGMIGSQDITVGAYSDAGASASLRTNVSPSCQAAMIEYHGQDAWDQAIAEQEAIAAAGGVVEAEALSDEAREELRQKKIETAAPLSPAITIGFAFLGLAMLLGRGVCPLEPAWPLALGGIGVGLAILLDALFIRADWSSGQSFLLLLPALVMALYGARVAGAYLATNDIFRVVFPPLILIVAVLGSILGGITNPTPAAALGAGGAILLAAHRRLKDEGNSGQIILSAAYAIVILILIGEAFDLRIARGDAPAEDWVAFLAAQIAYHFAMGGILFGCWVLLRSRILSPVIQQTAKVTSMVFTILICSQILNLVIKSFGGEHYIQDFLRSYDNELIVFLIVMLVLFLLGFVLDFLEIIYIVIPIVGPVIYGGSLDPKWVTIMIAINLQTSFLTPPFGFALFYLRGVAPPSVTTGQIYRGVIPFVFIQIIGLGLLWLFPEIVTIMPDLLGP